MSAHLAGAVVAPGSPMLGSSGPRLFGCVVMTLSGEPLWQGWLFKPSAKLQTKPLCKAVAQVLGRREDVQDSSFIVTGPYAVASVRDAEYIISIICSSTCPDSELLMKAKELAHNVKTLLGTRQVAVLSQKSDQELADMMATTDLLALFKLCYEAETEEYDADVGAWLDVHASDEVLQAFYINKLRLMSPSEDGFDHLEAVDGFVCAQLIDLADPGDVLLQRWQTDAKLRSVGISDGSPVLEMLRNHASSLWDIVMRETRAMMRQAANASYTHAQSSRLVHCTIDLSAFGSGLQATSKCVALRDYDPAYVVVYKVPSAHGASGAFRVSYEDSTVPDEVVQALHAAESLLLGKFPSSRAALLESIWPALATGGGLGQPRKPSTRPHSVRQGRPMPEDDPTRQTRQSPPSGQPTATSADRASRASAWSGRDRAEQPSLAAAPPAPEEQRLSRQQHQQQQHREDHDAHKPRSGGLMSRLGGLFGRKSSPSRPGPARREPPSERVATPSEAADAPVAAMPQPQSTPATSSLHMTEQHGAALSQRLPPPRPLQAGQHATVPPPLSPATSVQRDSAVSTAAAASPGMGSPRSTGGFSASAMLAAAREARRSLEQSRRSLEQSRASHSANVSHSGTHARAGLDSARAAAGTGTQPAMSAPLPRLQSHQLPGLQQQQTSGTGQGLTSATAAGMSQGLGASTRPSPQPQVAPGGAHSDALDAVGMFTAAVQSPRTSPPTGGGSGLVGPVQSHVSGQDRAHVGATAAASPVVAAAATAASLEPTAGDAHASASAPATGPERHVPGMHHAGSTGQRAAPSSSTAAAAGAADAAPDPGAPSVGAALSWVSHVVANSASTANPTSATPWLRRSSSSSSSSDTGNAPGHHGRHDAFSTAAGRNEGGRAPEGVPAPQHPLRHSDGGAVAGGALPADMSLLSRLPDRTQQESALELRRRQEAAAAATMVLREPRMGLMPGPIKSAVPVPPTAAMGVGRPASPQSPRRRRSTVEPPASPPASPSASASSHHHQQQRGGASPSRHAPAPHLPPPGVRATSPTRRIPSVARVLPPPHSARSAPGSLVLPQPPAGAPPPSRQQPPMERRLSLGPHAAAATSAMPGFGPHASAKAGVDHAEGQHVQRGASAHPGATRVHRATMPEMAELGAAAHAGARMDMAPSELERLWLRSQVGRWDLQLSRERAMRTWLAPDFGRRPPPGAAPGVLPTTPNALAEVVTAPQHRAADAVKPSDAAVRGDGRGGGNTGGDGGSLVAAGERARPTAVWRLVNGQWQQLCSDATWADAPVAGGPMASHAVPVRTPPRHARKLQGGGDARDQDFVRSVGGTAPPPHGGAPPAKEDVRRHVALRDVARERDASSPRGGDSALTVAATATAAAVAAAAAPVAAGVALQVWHSLQAGAFVGGGGGGGALHGALALPSMMLPGARPEQQVQQAASVAARAAMTATADVGGGAAAPAALNVHVGAASAPRYFSGPQGQLYCCVGDAWFELPTLAAMSAPAAHPAPPAVPAGTPTKL